MECHKPNCKQSRCAPIFLQVSPNHPSVFKQSAFPRKWGSEKIVKFSLQPCSKTLGRWASPENMHNRFPSITKFACNICNTNFLKPSLDSQTFVEHKLPQGRLRFPSRLAPPQPLAFIIPQPLSSVQAWNKFGGASYKSINAPFHIVVEGLPATPSQMVAAIHIPYSEPTSFVTIT